MRSKLTAERAAAIVRSVGSPRAAYAARRQIMRRTPKNMAGCQWIGGPTSSVPCARRGRPARLTNCSQTNQPFVAASGRAPARTRFSIIPINVP